MTRFKIFLFYNSSPGSKDVVDFFILQFITGQQGYWTTFLWLNNDPKPEEHNKQWDGKGMERESGNKVPDRNIHHGPFIWRGKKYTHRKW
jgi:hypothetical protein